MTDAPAFLTIEHVLAIHRRMIDEFGGDGTLRDYGLLEPAVMMSAAQFGGRFLHRGIPAMGTAYLFHLCKNHPFVDGNKRTALASAEVFMVLNGRRLTAGNEDLEEPTIGVADGRLAKKDAVAFFRRHASSDRA